ncbi:uncharacterized protein DUF262 [Mucilaginibacter yixingensis]|uniref:Uncharacterized protein DUF262 n=1 Tax=Mucilaginibacter yixingensis TaxID=1295612 RepID=A0A2T5J5Y9_9SPHI|nr:DUF262 domain-containing protein [Mucilaginibacter yixingensis]PTQ93953.1 uncharacterized protein DUF262 [Mucilaginibacter yixingensis]
MNYDELNEDNRDLIEIEAIDEGLIEDGQDIVSPFDPKDIKIIVEPKTIDHLVQRLKYDEIDMNTEFQRKGNLWKPDAQSRLIESLLLRFPLPAFYFDAEDDNRWLVVDGLQRIWTIKNFVVNSEKPSEDNKPLELQGLDILTDYNNKNITFKDLHRSMQRRILETQITTYLIQPGTPKQVKYNVFRRINTGGLGLNPMEIRNALNIGNASTFLRGLSEDDELRSLIKVQDKRMEDRELYLRAIAFINVDHTKYTTPLSGFLDKAMENLARLNAKELDKIKSGIIKAIKLQKELFGRDIFSRSIDKKSNLKLNSALFEVWVSETYKLLDVQQKKLVANKERLVKKYIQLISDPSFSRVVSTSTSGYSSVQLRFDKIKELINENIK